MYTYPEYLNACERIARDLMTSAHETDPVKFPYPGENVRLHRRRRQYDRHRVGRLARSNGIAST